MNQFMGFKAYELIALRKLMDTYRIGSMAELEAIVSHRNVVTEREAKDKVLKALDCLIEGMEKLP